MTPAKSITARPLALGPKTLGLAAALLEALPEAVLLCDEALRPRLANAAARQLLRLDGAATTALPGDTAPALDRAFTPGAMRQLRNAAAKLRATEAGKPPAAFALRGLPGLRFRLIAIAEGLLLLHVSGRARLPPRGRGRDPLTGLADRATLLAAVDALLADPAQPGFALHMLDFRGFRAVNDGAGPQAGDQILRRAARRLTEAVRADDLVARLGADEFAVLQRGQQAPPNAARLAERLIERLSQPMPIAGRSEALLARAGFALTPEDGATAALLLHRAGLALAEAKRAGTSAPFRFEPAMEARARARHDIATGLRDALAGNQFTLHYQPLLDMTTERVTGFEALIRWQHPEHGLIPPADFIPIAEEHGLIAPLGEWVLREASRQAAAWPSPLTLAVNVAVAQFADGHLVPMIREALAAAEFRPWRLEIEITESVVLAQTDSTREQIEQLQAMGIRVAVDDFGTGYSSLAQLRNFPFDRLKIDRGFVHDLPEGHESLAIIRAIAELGSALGLAITAEGVETESQRDTLRAVGCTTAQGNFYSPAIPAEAIPATLARLGIA